MNKKRKKDSTNDKETPRKQNQIAASILRNVDEKQLSAVAGGSRYCPTCGLNGSIDL
jgi:hypothetical protein